ncbi:hypothetical protein FA13DRAFT_1094954 [Coprinellus micaceus]|uniref:Uncharacterized protein n=1 Tax=Coprinellus micaceus TaxID=71717 RepID=A0A4Y7SWC8_COPMI|nr:hypothetical protein FA13DRAFT_1094954 [Coprinellus micaceus]
MAIVINPGLKYTWLRDNWSQAEYDAARDQIFNSLLSYRKHMRESGQLSAVPPTPPVSRPPPRPVPKASSASRAAFKAASGMARLNNIARTLSESAIAASTPSRSASAPTTAVGDRDVANPLVQDEDEDDKRAVEAEITKWETDGTEEAVDLLQFWEVRHGESTRNAQEHQADTAPIEKCNKISSPISPRRRHPPSAGICRSL